LDTGYQDDLLIVSGPRESRTGGVLLSQTNDRAKLENFLQQDPFNLLKLTTYEIIAFSPVKFHPEFTAFIK
jgi:uncharacterized protein YciI